MGLIMATIGTTIAAAGLIPAPSAFAQSQQGALKDDFGKGAAGGCGDVEGCGTHASQQEEPRAGTGNVGEVLLNCGHLTPDELARVLAAGGDRAAANPAPHP